MDMMVLPDERSTLRFFLHEIARREDMPIVRSHDGGLGGYGPITEPHPGGMPQIMEQTLDRAS